ncbi:MAG TPA: glycoside hydrolase family 3 N-terminal domain-containing protein [Candidatus Acidoferrales bacterium]|nr:glycoside hydrolase family 3 N-terminal domain-containing protein [Candidatus Acidoferrales bacterium]
MDGQRGIARRMVVGLPPEGSSPAWERDFAQFPPAGVIVFARDFRDLEDLRRRIARLRELARPRRLFVALDEEGGWVSQLAGHLVVPPNAALLSRGAAAGELEWIAGVTARRLRALGFDWDFAPVADVHSEADNPVIGPRAFGSEPAAVSEAVGAILRGFDSAGLAACLKHFPGHGDTRVDSHLVLPVCAADAATLRARELRPFADHPGADSVMSAHVVYPALDPERPATFSEAIVRRLLREELGFGGVCVTDALEMQGAAAGRTPAEAGAAALSAGCDLLLYAHWSEDVRRARLALADLLVEGAIDRAAFDDARPRLAAFDARRPEPTEAELAAPLDSLTPPDWTSRLEAIVERGLRIEGTWSGPAGSFAIAEPAFAHGGTLAADLAATGLVAGGASPRAQVIAIASRVPVPEAEIASLRARCGERPTVLVGLQNDAFLAGVPEAAVRISAGDATPLTRRVVARRIAALVRGRRG